MRQNTKAAVGAHYHQFTFPKHVGFTGPSISGGEFHEAQAFMELLIPDTARTLGNGAKRKEPGG